MFGQEVRGEMICSSIEVRGDERCLEPSNEGVVCLASEMEEGGMKCPDIEVCPAESKVVCPAPS